MFHFLSPIIDRVARVGRPRGRWEWWGSGSFWWGLRSNLHVPYPRQRKRLPQTISNEKIDRKGPTFRKYAHHSSFSSGHLRPSPDLFRSKVCLLLQCLAAPLDLATQAAHAIHLAKCGVRGIVLLGSTGEAVMISSEERKSLVSHVRQELESAGFEGYPIIAGMVI